MDDAVPNGGSADQTRDHAPTVGVFDPLRLDAVPAELKALNQWLCWMAGPPRKPGGKPSKFPVNPHTGKLASSTDATTWGTYDEALAAALKLGLAGVGFVFKAGGGVVGVDLDACRDPETGVIELWAQQIITSLNGYAEVSPTGTGLHVVVQGELPKGRRRKGPIEMYEEARFFTVTGAHVDGTPLTIEERTTALAALHAATFGEPAKPTPKPKRKAEPTTKPAPQPVIDTDDGLIAKAKTAKNGDAFSRLWSGDYSGHPSQSEGDLALCGMLAFWTAGDEARMDALFRQSGLMREKWDERHGEQTYGQLTIVKALQDRTEFYSPDGPDGEDDPDGGGRARGTFTAALVNYVIEQCADLFHDSQERAYATLPTCGHFETVRLDSRRFHSWLCRIAFKEYKRSASSQVVSDTRATLTGFALHDRPEETVFVRVGHANGRVYLDLGRPEWDVVEITAAGWEVLPLSPVKFIRPAGLKPLPRPERGGSMDELRPFVNCADRHWPLVKAWLAMTLHPLGPYPLLNLTGVHGSAKSSTARHLRNVVDPNKAPLRSQPADDRDLMIAASNSHVQAYDNLSAISSVLSDAFCRLSTGGGHATRMLYTNDEEAIFDVQRPVVLTGIEDIVVRPDLLDRTLVIECPEISKDKRRPEDEIRAEFEVARPRILGALLSAVSVGLGRRRDIRLAELPRMADFAKWAVACGPGLGVTEDEFLDAYEANQEEALDIALEADTLAQAVRKFLATESLPYETTAEKLLAQVNARRGDTPPPKGWPRSPRGLAGGLRRAVHTLRSAGIHLEFVRDRGPDRTRLIRFDLRGPPSVRTVRDRPNGPPEHRDEDKPVDPTGRSSDGVRTVEPSTPSEPWPAAVPTDAVRTVSDGPDGRPAPLGVQATLGLKPTARSLGEDRGSDPPPSVPWSPERAERALHSVIVGGLLPEAVDEAYARVERLSGRDRADVIVAAAHAAEEGANGA